MIAKQGERGYWTTPRILTAVWHGVCVLLSIVIAAESIRSSVAKVSGES